MVLSPLTRFFFREENTQSPKLATNCKIYHYHHFLEVLHWTRELCLWQPWESIFAGIPMFPFNDRKLSNSYFCFHVIFWKRSSAQVGCGFENHALLLCWKSKFFLLKVQNCLKKNNFSRLIFTFMSLCTLIGGLAHLTELFCKKTKKLLKLQKR